MIQFLKNIWRNLTKNRSSLIINLLGFSLSFAFVLAIALWVYDEVNVDKFHKWDKQLYQVLGNHQTPEGITTQAWTPDLLARTLAEEVLIACLLAFPAAWIIMNRWLEGFAYKTPQNWWIFALAGIITVGIAILTVSWQSWKAATNNPVEALKYE